MLFSLPKKVTKQESEQSTQDFDVKQHLTQLNIATHDFMKRNETDVPMPSSATVRGNTKPLIIPQADQY